MLRKNLNLLAIILVFLFSTLGCGGASDPHAPGPTGPTGPNSPGTIVDQQDDQNSNTDPQSDQQDQTPTDPLASCPIPKSALKVSLPYISVDEASVVMPLEWCGADAYKRVQVLNVIDTRSAPYSVKQPSSSVDYFTVTFVLRQKHPSSSDLFRLHSDTGIDTDDLKTYAIIRSAGKATVLNTELPGKTKVDFFLPTTTSQDGAITFSSSNKSDMEALLEQLKTTAGIRAELPIGLLQGSETFTYTVKLRASRDVEVTDIR